MEKSLIINEHIEVEAEEVFKVKINGKDHYLNKEEYDKYKERCDYIQKIYGNNVINQNQEEKIIIFEEGFVNDDLLIGGNGDEIVV